MAKCVPPSEQLFTSAAPPTAPPAPCCHSLSARAALSAPPAPIPLADAAAVRGDAVAEHLAVDPRAARLRVRQPLQHQRDPRLRQRETALGRGAVPLGGQRAELAVALDHG